MTLLRTDFCYFQNFLNGMLSVPTKEAIYMYKIRVKVHKNQSEMSFLIHTMNDGCDKS